MRKSGLTQLIFAVIQRGKDIIIIMDFTMIGVARQFLPMDEFGGSWLRSGGIFHLYDLGYGSKRVVI